MLMIITAQMAEGRSLRRTASSQHPVMRSQTRLDMNGPGKHWLHPSRYGF